ncbi:MAG: flagellar export protein FliJ [Bdellovibrionales bacterium]|nr:flagellar export protein FliJ [Bdellovibrionales bacterium]
MKRFKFRLQKVLDFKETEKKERAQQLAQENQRLLSLEERMQAILEEQEVLGGIGDAVMTIEELCLTGDYKQRLQDELEQQREHILLAAKAVDEAREAYIEKTKETESLEAVKRRRKQEHLEEAKKKEKKQIDETVVQRHRFTKNNGG